MDQAYWLSEFDRLEQSYRASWPIEFPPDGAVLCNRDACQALPSYLDMYQWSLDTIHLQRFQERADQIIGYRQIDPVSEFTSWLTVDGTDRPVPRIWVDMAIGGVLLRFANLAANVYSFQAKAEEYRLLGKFIADQWAKAWLWGPSDYGVFTKAGKSLPNNLLGVCGRFCYEYRDAVRTQALANSLRSILRPHPTVGGGVIWNYADAILPSDPVPTNLRVDDINHAGGLISFAAVAMIDVIPKIRATIESAWNRDTESPNFLWRLDGTETVVSPNLPYYRHMELGGSIYPAVATQWSKLVNYQDTVNRPGTYMSMPALVLLHAFRQWI